MAELFPRELFAIERLGGQRVIGPKPDKSLACWNWALTGYRAGGISPDPFLFYIRGNLDWQGLTAVVQAIPRVAMDPFNHERNELERLRALWTTGNNGGTYTDAPQTAAKIAAIETITADFTKCMSRINGLAVSAVKTDYQVCMHFPSVVRAEDMQDVAIWQDQMVNGVRRQVAIGKRRPNAHELAEFQAGLVPNFQHWWLRVRERTTVETFPNTQALVPYTQILPYNCPGFPNGEQEEEYYKTVRFYIRELHQEQVTIIRACLEEACRQKKKHPPFAAFAQRQNRQADRDAAECNWCGVRFGVFTRKHHCRRCGLIYCDPCSAFVDNVATPATPATEAPVAFARKQRICLTCLL